jgi:hypothetical protein
LPPSVALIGCVYWGRHHHRTDNGSKPAESQGKTVKIKVTATIALATVAVILWAWASRRTASRSELSSLMKPGAVIAQTARIEDQGDAMRILVLKSASVAHSVPPAGSKVLVIIPDGSWVPGQVEIASRNKSERNIHTNLHAILPTEIRIFQEDRAGRFRVVEDGHVNYLRIE